MNAILCAILIAMLSTSSTLAPTGIGSLRFGMTPKAAAAAGVKLLPLGAPVVPPACAYLRPAAPSGLEFMVEGGTLRRADLRNPKVRTSDGFAVGDRAAAIERFYGKRAQVFPNKYDPKALEIVVTPAGADAAKYRMIYKVKGGAVYEILAGLLPQVEYVERCG